MYYSLRGTLIYKDGYTAAVECGGVGYQCAISTNTYAQLPELGAEVKLYTHLLVREDAMELFGFVSDGERKCFRTLISVSGVGAKVGLAILSVLTPDQVAFAILSDDAKMLTGANGVGPKLAKRIVLELKDKFKGAAAEFDGASLAASVPQLGKTNAGEATAALMALGYSQSEAASALAGCDAALPVEDMIRTALKALARM